MAGRFTNSTVNTQQVVFGGTGPVSGTAQVNGATATASTDLLLAKYTNQGSRAVLRWTQVGGGTSGDVGYGVAVSGTSVYVVGALFNSTTNANAVVLGGNGTAPGTVQVNGASLVAGRDLLLAKYTDNGPTATLAWTQVAGGSGTDLGLGVAVSGTAVYVTGTLTNSAGNADAVLFEGGGTVAGTAAVPSIGATASQDLLLAKNLDQGGYYGCLPVGPGRRRLRRRRGLRGVAVSGQRVLVAGGVVGAASFGPTTLTATAGTRTAALPYLTDIASLPTRAAGAGPGLNPVSGAARLAGGTPGVAVQVLDALSRVAATATADAAGTTRLAGLAPGFYLVRAGGTSVRLAVE